LLRLRSLREGDGAVRGVVGDGLRVLGHAWRCRKR
jgi:hypothetical protein